MKNKNADVSDNKKSVASVKNSSQKSSSVKKGKSKKSKCVKESQEQDSASLSDESGDCKIVYDAMDVKVEEVVRNFRIFAEAMRKGKKKTKKVTVAVCSI